MKNNLLGGNIFIQPSKSTIERLKMIKAVFDTIMLGPIARRPLTIEVGVSASTITKIMKLFYEAGIANQAPVTGFAQPVSYSFIPDHELLVEFNTQLTNHILYSEQCVAGVVEWQPPTGEAPVPRKEKFGRTNLFTVFEYAPGRRIYSSDAHSAHSMRQLSKEQMQIDPLRKAGLL